MEKMPENIKKDVVDPTTSSPLPENLHLTKVKDLNIDTGSEVKHFQIFEEALTKEKYFSRKENSSYEYFITLLSKGILHVSDIIRKEDALYSREMPVSNIENASSEEEKKSEIFLLSFLFNDKDHIPEAKANFREENNTFVHFDYDAAFSWKQDGKPVYADNVPDPEQIKKELELLFNKQWYPSHLRNKQEIIENEKSLKRDTFKEILLQKTDQFIDRLSDESFFDAIIKKSNINLLDEKFSFLTGASNEEKSIELRNLMMQRLINLKETLSK